MSGEQKVGSGLVVDSKKSFCNFESLYQDVKGVLSEIVAFVATSLRSSR